MEELPLSQSTVSQHLKELKSIGLIQGTIDGTSVCYCINTEKWEEIKNKFAAFFALPADKKTNCCT